MINIEFYWNDLTEVKQKEIREALKMDADDNGNWDVFPMATMEIEDADND